MYQRTKLKFAKVLDSENEGGGWATEADVENMKPEGLSKEKTHTDAATGRARHYHSPSFYYRLSDKIFRSYIPLSLLLELITLWY
jgi:hypothetical protein